MAMGAVEGVRRARAASLRARRKKLHRDLTLVLHVPGRTLSLYDVFWDLGVNDFALEIMFSQGILPGAGRSLDDVRAQLVEYIREHGSYEAFVQELLDSISEVYKEHLRMGHRRAMPSLINRGQKLLPSPESIGVEEAEGSQSDLPQGFLLDMNLKERALSRANMGTYGLVHTHARSSDVDIDQLGRLDPLSLLGSLFQGTFASAAKGWFKMRQLRQLRKELDVALSTLFRFFDARAREDVRFLEPLYDLANRWSAEGGRISALAHDRPWKGKAWALSADILMEEALAMSEALELRAFRNTKETLESLRGYADRGDLPMAGYLVYLNHYAFFARLRSDYSHLIRDVEFATGRIQRELGALRAKQII